MRSLKAAPSTARILLVGLILTVVGGVCAAQAATVNLVARPYQSPHAGDDVVVAVAVNPANGLTAGDFVFRYDASTLTPLAVFRTGATNSFALSSNLANTGFVEIHLSGGSPLSGSVEVAWVRFQIRTTSVATTSLSWVAATLNAGTIPSSPVALSLPVLTGPVTISMPDTAKGAPSTQIQVPITATTFSGAGSFDLSLTFNPAVLTPVSVAKTSLTNCLTIISNLGIPGTVNVALYGTCTVSGSGAIAQVTFNIVGSLGSKTPFNLTRAGINEGAIATVLDDGLLLTCTNADSDGDGLSTCAGDCNDANAAIKPGASEVCNGTDDNCDGVVDNVALPQGTPSLAVGKGAGGAVISWPSIVGATAYDAVSGSVASLRSHLGDYAVATNRCLVNDTVPRLATDAANPAVGDAIWYLVRAENCGGFGTYDEGAAAQFGFRDPGIAGSPQRCQ